MKKTILPLALLGLCTYTSQAVVTFVSVEAGLGNISLSTSVTGGGQNDTDDLWRQRNGFGEGGVTVLEGWDNQGGAPVGTAEDVPVLTQTITGLTSGVTYDVYINYIRFGVTGGVPLGDRGSIRGSLDGTSFQTFETPGGTAGTVGFAELTGHSDADRLGVRGYLGTAIADISGEISVFADDGSANELVERIWFDGASFEAVPEPSTAILGLFGALGLLRRRR